MHFFFFFFFLRIRENCHDESFTCEKCRDESITPATFMSDMANNFYNAWCKIFNEPHQRLFCAWHVDKAWRDRLNLTNKIHKNIYKRLKTIEGETNERQFSLLY